MYKRQLFAPACGQMINRIMYMSEAVMEADEAIGRLDEILSQQPMEEPKVQKSFASDAVAFDHVLSLIHISLSRLAAAASSASFAARSSFSSLAEARMSAAFSCTVVTVPMTESFIRRPAAVTLSLIHILPTSCLEDTSIILASRRWDQKPLLGYPCV